MKRRSWLRVWLALVVIATTLWASEGVKPVASGATPLAADRGNDSLNALVSPCDTAPDPGRHFWIDDIIDGVDTAPGNGLCETDDGRCPLRAAIMEANALPGCDTVWVPPGDYVLTIPRSLEARISFDAADKIDSQGDLDILDDLALLGSGADVTTIRRSSPPEPSDRSPSAFRVLQVSGEPADPVTAWIHGVTLQGPELRHRRRTVGRDRCRRQCSSAHLWRVCCGSFVPPPARRSTPVG